MFFDMNSIGVSALTSYVSAEAVKSPDRIEWYRRFMTDLSEAVADEDAYHLLPEAVEKDLRNFNGDEFDELKMHNFLSSLINELIEQGKKLGEPTHDIAILVICMYGERVANKTSNPKLTLQEFLQRLTYHSMFAIISIKIPVTMEIEENVVKSVVETTQQSMELVYREGSLDRVVLGMTVTEICRVLAITSNRYLG